MDVKDDNEFKKVFSQGRKSLSKFRPIRKGSATALPFESYDPDIYVNIEAEVFSPTIVLEDEINNIGTITNIPITDPDAVVNRLIVWFERDIFKGVNYNTSIYILASAFNKFGIDKQKATEYGFRYAKSEAPEKEVHAIINSGLQKHSRLEYKIFRRYER